MSDIRAVLFDFDGTLVNSEPLVENAMKHALSTAGCEVPAEGLFESTTGMTIEDSYRLLAPHADNALLVSLHREYQKENVGDTVLYDGTLETLQALETSGIAMAICSSRSSWIREMLAVTGIERFFPVVLTRHDVVNPKPNPESLLKALLLLGKKPEEAMMVGDTFVDILAGRNAHIAKTIAFVPHEMNPRLAETEPEIIIKSLPELLELV